MCNGTWASFATGRVISSDGQSGDCGQCSTTHVQIWLHFIRRACSCFAWYWYLSILRGESYNYGRLRMFNGDGVSAFWYGLHAGFNKLSPELKWCDHCTYLHTCSVCSMSYYQYSLFACAGKILFIGNGCLYTPQKLEFCIIICVKIAYSKHFPCAKNFKILHYFT